MVSWPAGMFLGPDAAPRRVVPGSEPMCARARQKRAAGRRRPGLAYPAGTGARPGRDEAAWDLSRSASSRIDERTIRPSADRPSEAKRTLFAERKTLRRLR